MPKMRLFLLLACLACSCIETVSRELPPLEGPFAVIIIAPPNSTPRYMVRRRADLEQMPIVAEPSDIYILDYACGEIPCQLRTEALAAAVDLEKRESGMPLFMPKSNRIYSAHLGESGLSAWTSTMSWPPSPLLEFDVHHGEGEAGWCRCSASVRRVELLEAPRDFGFAEPVGDDFVAISPVLTTGVPMDGRVCDAEGSGEISKGPSYLYLVRVPVDGEDGAGEAAPIEFREDGESTLSPLMHGNLAALLLDGDNDNDNEPKLTLLNRCGEFHTYIFERETGFLTRANSTELPPVDLGHPRNSFQQAEISASNGALLLLTRDLINSPEDDGPRDTTARLRYLPSGASDWVELGKEPAKTNEKIRPQIQWADGVAYFTGYRDELMMWKSYVDPRALPEFAVVRNDPIPSLVSGIVPLASGEFLVAGAIDWDQFSTLRRARVDGVSRLLYSEPPFSVPLSLLFPIVDMGLFDRNAFLTSGKTLFPFYNLDTQAEICAPVSDDADLADVPVRGDLYRTFRIRDQIVRVYKVDHVWWVDFLKMDFGIDQPQRCEF